MATSPFQGFFPLHASCIEGLELRQKKREECREREATTIFLVCENTGERLLLMLFVCSRS